MALYSSMPNENKDQGVDEITLIYSPLGNFISRILSQGAVRSSLQWIRVSSRSNTKVLQS